MSPDEPDEPSAQVDLAPQWVFRVGSRDARLILKALDARMTEDDMREARVLCDRLTAMRHRGGESLMDGLARANDGMERAREARGLEPDPLRSAKRRRP